MFTWCGFRSCHVGPWANFQRWFIMDYSQEQCFKGVREAGQGRWRKWTAMQLQQWPHPIPQSFWKLEWPLRFDLNWSKKLGLCAPPTTHPHQLLTGNVLAPSIGCNLEQPKDSPGEGISCEPSAASTLVLGKQGSWCWRQIWRMHHNIHCRGGQQRLWGC